MKTNELRELSVEELNARVRELRKDLLNMRIQRASGQLENTARPKLVRKEVARILTIINERRHGIDKVRAEKIAARPAAAPAPAASKPAAKKAPTKKAVKKKAE